MHPDEEEARVGGLSDDEIALRPCRGLEHGLLAPHVGIG